LPAPSSRADSALTLSPNEACSLSADDGLGFGPLPGVTSKRFLVEPVLGDPMSLSFF
jgi:hypothetical protein